MTTTNNNVTIVVGIDYSMVSPAICIHTGAGWSLSNCVFHFLTNKKKFDIQTPPFFGQLQDSYRTPEERFDSISKWAIATIPYTRNVYIEGYSYASKGKVFHIGENTGLLKHKIWLRDTSIDGFSVISPTTIKKFATTKGNANKIQMFNTFIEETNCDLRKYFLTGIGTSPTSDIIDAYYICKYGWVETLRTAL